MEHLTLYYDGNCPICSKEIQQLVKHDTHSRLKLIDVHSDSFTSQTLVSKYQAMEALHAVNIEGKVYIGLDAAYQAWAMVGKDWLYRPTRLPLVKPIADIAYRWFARNRYRVSARLFGSTACVNGQCKGK